MMGVLPPQRGYFSLQKRFQAAFTAILVLAPLAPQTESQLAVIVESIIADQVIFTNHHRFLFSIALGLYWHQDLEYLNQYLTEYFPVNQELSEALVVANAIAISCRQEFNPRTLLSVTCQYLSQGSSPNSHQVINQLKLAQSLVEKGESRAIALQVLPKTSLAYGLFCFLSTPHNFQLATYDCGRFKLEITAIAATYQGYTFDQFGMSAARKLSDRLLRAWAGVYDLTDAPAISRLQF